MALTDLPVEILYAIADSVDSQQDLGRLRQTCLLLSDICTPTLFRSTYVWPTSIDEAEELAGDMSEPWRLLARDDDLRSHVRHLTFVFNKYINETPGVLDFFRLRFPPSAPDASHHFPNLRSLNLRLASKLRGPAAIREQFYAAVAAVAACPIRSLTITLLNLFDAGPDGRALLHLRKFAVDDHPGILQRLHLCLIRCDTLHLQNPRDTGGWDRQERNWASAPRLLRHDWLKPNAQFLTHLSLYCESYWGAFPLVVLNRVRFPRLKCLALGNYAFAQPAQLDAICGLHTLEMLLLDDCPILFLVVLYCWSVEKLGIETLHWESIKTADPDLYAAWTTKMSWAAYFDQMAAQLPRLRHFGFRPGDWTWSDLRPKAVEQHNEFSVNWHPQSRYTAYSAIFDRWYEVLQRPPGREDKFWRVDLDMELNWQLRDAFDDHLKGDTPQVTSERISKDKAALGRLLDVAGARAREFEDLASAQ